MSYKDRRRFLWVLFLIGLALIAVVAQATTLVRLRFQDLVHYSYSIARVRCVHTDTRMENGEIWTDTSSASSLTTRVISPKKSSSASSAENSNTCIRASMARPNSVPAKRSIYF